MDESIASEESLPLVIKKCLAVDRHIASLEHDLKKLNAFRAAPSVTSEEEGDVQVLPRIQENVQDLRVRLDELKRDPEAASHPGKEHVCKVGNRARAFVVSLQRANEEHLQRFARGYRIVCPNASDSEIRDKFEEWEGGPVFAQALLQTSRRDEAEGVRTRVKTRHDALERIERDLIQLAQMFQWLDELVQGQEPQVTNIERRGDEVVDNVNKGNNELDGANEKAKAARRKKRLCLILTAIITLVVLIVIVVAVVILLKVNGVF